jgi:tRNA threonylcarbamoyladenosine biosynthesis protein TsaE
MYDRSTLSHSISETKAVAADLANTLQKGDIIAFFGGLGSGKTAFMHGVAAGLGYEGFVTSPTFTVCNEYIGGKVNIYHFDMYRIKTEADLESIGFYDYLDRGGIIAIEWFENIKDFDIVPTVTVTIETLDENTRKISIKKI